VDIIDELSDETGASIWISITLENHVQKSLQRTSRSRVNTINDRSFFEIAILAYGGKYGREISLSPGQVVSPISSASVTQQGQIFQYDLEDFLTKSLSQQTSLTLKLRVQTD